MSKIRNTGGSLGFDKVIIKNGMVIMFFVANPMSPYYKSPVFKTILTRVAEQPSVYTLKQVESKLKIVSRGVDTLEKALAILKKLQ